MTATDHLSLSPAERRRLKTRDSILDAAEKLFAEEGEAGLSIRRIAEEVDYSPAAIYKYFKSKQDLVDELKNAFFARMIVAMDKVKAQTSSFEAQAMAGMCTYVETALERPHHYLAAFSGLSDPAEGDPGACQDSVSAKDQAFAHLKDMVAGGVQTGVFRAGLDVDLAAKSIWASCHGLAMLMAHLPAFPRAQPTANLISRHDFIHHHASMIFRSLAADPET